MLHKIAPWLYEEWLTPLNGLFNAWTGFVQKSTKVSQDWAAKWLCLRYITVDPWASVLCWHPLRFLAYQDKELMVGPLFPLGCFVTTLDIYWQRQHPPTIRHPYIPSS